jgi:hypothetical protein
MPPGEKTVAECMAVARAALPGGSGLHPLHTHRPSSAPRGLCLFVEAMTQPLELARAEGDPEDAGARLCF